MSDELLPRVELAPEGDVDASVIWLHGLGADGHDFEPVVPMLGLPPDLRVRFVFPHAPSIPVTLNQGFVMPAWYDIQEIDLKRRHDEAGIRRSASQVRDLIALENERGIPTERIVLAGFSQGGAIALFEGLRHEKALAGVMALSTYLVCEESLDDERTQQNAQVPIFQAHGTMDPMVPIERGQAARDALVGRDYLVEWHEYPMQHAVHPDEIQDIGRWLTDRLGS
ncbi:MAG: dienelactone hydrolase family protein [Planctomycetota bacterium]